MSEGFVWASYLVTYGLVVGYVATVWSRIRSHQRQRPDRES
jgi:hypothetical protein